MEPAAAAMSNLAAAYGIAVTTTMVITTALAFVAMRDIWRWRLAAALAVTGSSARIGRGGTKA
jgi:K+ transporter